jgi:RNA polymerase sigma factor (sigma-70 family)
MSYSDINFSKLSDSELLENYKQTHDKKVIGELYKRYTHLILGMCINFYRDRDDAEDALLQIFEQLMEDLKKHEVNCFKAWLICKVKNYCLNDLRCKDFQNLAMQEFQQFVCTDVSEPDKELIDKKENMLERLHKSIHELNDFQKKCIELYYLQNKSYAQIVAITGYSLKEVKSYLQNGKRNLKLILLNNK